MIHFINNKIILTLVVSILLFSTAATLTYHGLRSLSTNTSGGQQGGQQQELDNNKTPLETADVFYKAGDSALKEGNLKEGIEQLKKALNIYEEKGDAIMIAQTQDQIAMAELALKAEADHEASASEAEEDKGKTNVPR